MLERCRPAREVYTPNLKKSLQPFPRYEQTKFRFNFFVFSSSTSSFRTLRKIRHKTRIRTEIGLKFGALKGLIKADRCTNFDWNPMNIHGVITDYLRKIRSKVCHAYRVNSFEESVENCYVDGATIVGVPVCGLKKSG